MAQDDLTELSGVGGATADKLNDAGYETFQAIAVTDPSQLSQNADVGDSKASKIVSAARDAADIGGFDTATSVMEERSKMHKISTQVDAVDEILDGGVETQAITEFYGEFGSGKSQFTHQMAVNVQLPPEVGGAGGTCFFIDTEDSFRPKRIAQMVRGLEEDILEVVLENSEFDFTVDEVKDAEVRTTDDPTTPAEVLASQFLENIFVAKAFSSDHQLLLLEKAREKANALANDPDSMPVKLVMIDSLIAHFRSEYVGRGQLAKRQQKLNKHLHDLKTLTNSHNAAAIVANQVQSNPDSYFGDPTDPVGGNILGHTSTFRIYLRNSKENKRVVKLVNAPNLPDREAVARITNDGLKDE